VAGAAARAALLDRARAVFERTVMLRARQGRAAAALEALERGRASLAPMPRAGPAPVPRGEGVAVAYALIGDTLLAWTVSGGEVRMARGRWTRTRSAGRWSGRGWRWRPGTGRLRAVRSRRCTSGWCVRWRRSWGRTDRP
jgi:hypothetical protein